MAVETAAELSPWVRTIVDTYIAEEAFAFLVHGEVFDYVTAGKPAREYLAALFGPQFPTVVHYSPGSGFSFASDAARDTFLQTLADETGDTSMAAANMAEAGPQVAIPMILAFLERAERHTALAIITRLDLIAPDAPIANLDAGQRALLDVLHEAGTKTELERSENMLLMLAPSLTRVHEDIRSSTSGIKAVEIMLPDYAQRLEYIHQRVRQDTAGNIGELPLIELEMSEPALAAATASLTRRNVEDVLLRGKRAGMVTWAIANERKAEIIKAESGGLLEIRKPKGGFGRVGGQQHFKDWAGPWIIQPAHDSDPEVREAMPLSLLLDGPPGTGKGHPVSTPVLTPDGWAPIGTLQPGDAIIGSDGQPTQVLAVYDRGELPVFDVQFSDGTSVLCDGDHLWNIREKRGRQWRAVNVRCMRNIGVTRSSGRARFKIPMVAPVEHPERQLPLAPYLLGVLLANGSLGGGSPIITTNDEHVVRRAQIEAGEAIILKENAPSTAARRWIARSITGGRKNTVIDALRSLGLWGSKSRTKFIPDQYLFASVAQRLSLLQALMDCDGSETRPTNGSGKTNYTTMSERLANGVAMLVRSFGGTACVAQHKRGEWTLAINMPSDICPFSTPRKAERYFSRGTRRREPVRCIVGIEPAGREQVRCIRVAATDALYVTEDYLVTHNTLIAECLAYEIQWNLLIYSQGKGNGIYGSAEADDARAKAMIKASAPCVVFMDEVDQDTGRVTGGTGGAADAAEKALFKSRLEFMGDTSLRGEVLFIGASNRPDQIDDALMSRFEYRVPILPAEDDAARADQLARMLIDKGVPADADALIPVAKVLTLPNTGEGWSGRDMVGVVTKARGLMRLHKLNYVDAMMQSAKTRKPLQRADAQLMTQLAIAETNDLDLLPPKYRKQHEQIDRQELDKEVAAVRGRSGGRSLDV